MPNTVKQIQEAFGYPLLTHAQHVFMTETVHHRLVLPWFHAIKTWDKKKQMWDIVEQISNNIFYHGRLFYWTVERVQEDLKNGVWLQPVKDSPKIYGEEALAILAERAKEELIKRPSRQPLLKPMKFEDVPQLKKAVIIAENADRGMCDLANLPYVDKGLGMLPDVVRKQIEFLQTLESEK